MSGTHFYFLVCVHNDIIRISVSTSPSPLIVLRWANISFLFGTHLNSGDGYDPAYIDYNIEVGPL